MSSDPPKSPLDSDSKPENLGEPNDDPITGMIALPELEKAIESAPEPAKPMLREIGRVLGVFHSRTVAPYSPLDNVSPEVAKALIESKTKDNDNKFEMAKQRQKDSHEFETKEQRNSFVILCPLIFIIALVFAACLFIGIYLAVHGYEILGSCILTAVITSILAYLAGLGTADLMRRRRE